MRILVWLESVGYGEAALGWYVVRALRELGHQVQPFDYADYARPIPQTILQKLVRRSRLLMSPHPLDRQMNRDLIARVEGWRPDLLLVTKGNPIFPQTLQRLRERQGALLFNWAPDDPFHPRYASKWLRASIPLYDLWLLPVRSREEPVRAAGAVRTHYLPFACEPAVHRRLPLATHEEGLWKSQVCFVGTGYPERAALLARLQESDLAIWGERWAPGWTSSRLRQRIRGGGIYMDDMARAYSGAQVVINIHQAQDATGMNMRTFEALGCGAFLVDQRSPDGLEVFAEGEEWVCYGNADELVRQVNHYLAHPEERQTIARQGQATAYDRHTYRHRMEEVIDLARSLNVS